MDAAGCVGVSCRGMDGFSKTANAAASLAKTPGLFTQCA